MDQSPRHFRTLWETFAVFNAVSRVSVSCLFPKMFAVKVDVKLLNRIKRRKLVVLGLNFGGRGNPKFWTSTFKSGSLKTFGEVYLSSVQ